MNTHGSLGRFSYDLARRAGRKIRIAAAVIVFEAPPPGYGVLWAVGVGEVLTPVEVRVLSARSWWSMRPKIASGYLGSVVPP